MLYNQLAEYHSNLSIVDYTFPSDIVLISASSAMSASSTMTRMFSAIDNVRLNIKYRLKLQVEKRNEG